jgi:hypothetical protein
MATSLVSGCAVQIKDEPLYVDEGALGAVEVHLFTPGSTDISESQWAALRFGMVCMSAQSFGDIKLEIESLCSKASCDEQTTQAMQNIIQILERVQIVSRQIKP